MVGSVPRSRCSASVRGHLLPRRWPQIRSSRSHPFKGRDGCLDNAPMTGNPDAVVIGSGPNGLAAAITLAAAGLSVIVLEAHTSIGGGTRTAELTIPGLRHDHCAAVHPLAVASPYLRTLPLDSYGLRWRWPEIDLAHPLDNGRAVLLARSVTATASGLGADSSTWERLFSPLVDSFDQLAAEVLGPALHRPRHPGALASFALRAGLPAQGIIGLLRTEPAKALFAGIAAHGAHPLERPATAAIGVVLAAAGQQSGWPVAEGGSARITDALAAILLASGGRVETGVAVTDLAEIPPSLAILLDTSPAAADRIAGDRLPVAIRRAYKRWRYGPAAFKLDLAVEGGVPWTAEPCRRAATVHVGGTASEIAKAESDVHHGRLPARPFVLVAQQYLCDPGRSSGDVHPVWAYAHVPHGYPGDASGLVLDQIERFAPGLRERIVGSRATPPADLEAYDANYVGGDIATGANSLRQLLFRPRVTAHPYDTGIPGVYLCSAATPPGAGVHGMCGHLAARRALSRLRLPLDPVGG